MHTSNQILLEATQEMKKILSGPDKWIKGSKREGDKCCLIGALDDVYRDMDIPGLYFDMRTELRLTIDNYTSKSPMFPKNFMSIPKFNDASETQFADIKYVLNQTEKRLKARIRTEEKRKNARSNS